eukprot:3008882-Pleurochrysis_carterae.AAC.3
MGCARLSLCLHASVAVRVTASVSASLRRANRQSRRYVWRRRSARARSSAFVRSPSAADK